MSEEQWYGSTGSLGLSRLGMMRLGLANTPPRFVMEPYVFTVAADAAVGTFVGQVFAVDDCADEITYTLHGPDAVNFSVHPTTGVITTAAALSEDTYTFIARATDIEGAPCGVDEADVTVLGRDPECRHQAVVDRIHDRDLFVPGVRPTNLDERTGHRPWIQQDLRGRRAGARAPHLNPGGSTRTRLRRGAASRPAGSGKVRRPSTDWDHDRHVASARA